MLDELRSLTVYQISTTDILVNVTVALVCGLFIAALYRFTYRGPGYSSSFVNSIVLLAMITAIVIMVIGNNLARAFGLVGAMSIIRFRTAVKETIDIVYIFFGLAIGMAAGVGYHKIAFIGTFLVGSILFLFSKSSLSVSKKEEFLLQFSYQSTADDMPAYIPILKKHCRRYQVINVKSPGSNDDYLEMAYYVKFKDKNRSTQLVNELKTVSEISHINLFFDDEQL